MIVAEGGSCHLNCWYRSVSLRLREEIQAVLRRGDGELSALWLLLAINWVQEVAVMKSRCGYKGYVIEARERQTAREILKPLDRCHPGVRAADRFDFLPLLAETALPRFVDNEIFLAAP